MSVPQIKRLSYHGQRTALHPEPKPAGYTTFDPQVSELWKTLYGKYWQALLDESKRANGPFVRSEATRPDFIMPVTVIEVREALARFDKSLLQDLTGIVLLGGSSKQRKVAWSSLFAFGCYNSFWKIISLFAFPKNALSEYSQQLPPPHIRQEYERAGAVYHRDGRFWVRRFTPEALRRFYLHDVLVHEIAHHADRRERRAKEAESFANSFVQRRIAQQKCMRSETILKRV